MTGWEDMEAVEEWNNTDEVPIGESISIIQCSISLWEFLWDGPFDVKEEIKYRKKSVP